MMSKDEASAQVEKFCGQITSFTNFREEFSKLLIEAHDRGFSEGVKAGRREQKEVDAYNAKKQMTGSINAFETAAQESFGERVARQSMDQYAAQQAGIPAASMAAYRSRKIESVVHYEMKNGCHRVIALATDGTLWLFDPNVNPNENGWIGFNPLPSEKLPK